MDLFDGYPKNVLKRFKEFHQSNPQVWKAFKKLAFEMKSTGKKKYSARTMFEVMRWEYDLKTNGDVFEINGDFVPIYCRLLIHNHPEFTGFFELRRVRSKGISSQEERNRLETTK